MDDTSGKETRRLGYFHWKNNICESLLDSPLKVGVEIEFTGDGINEKAFVTSSNNENYKVKIGQEVLSIDPQYFRPTEVDLLIGDPSKAKNKLGWVPEYSLPELVKDMMRADLKLFAKK